jgi:hypothetical protein
MEIRLEFTDPRVIDLIESLPQADQSAYIERCILLSDTVMRYAQVTTSEANLQRYFEPTLNGLDGAIRTLTQLHMTYDGVFGAQYQTLERIIPAMAASVTRGAITNEAVFQSLCDSFRDDAAQDVSGKAKYTDLCFTPAGCGAPVLIELKDYTNDVPSMEVDKFWRDLDARSAKVGVFVSMNTRIQTLTSDFTIQTRGGQLGVFIVNSEFGHRGYLLAYALARRLMLALEDRAHAPDMDKLGFMAKVLNRHLRQVGDEMKTLAGMKDDLEKAHADFSGKLTRITGKMDGLRQRVQNIVEDTLRDFAEELPETSS